MNDYEQMRSSAAFQVQRQYSYVNRSAFYANIRGEYRQYMTRWVQDDLWWYDGWVPYFHNSDRGIFSTRLGEAIVNNAAKKVAGTHIFFKTEGKETPVKGADGKYLINPSLSFIATDWASKSGIREELKKAITYAGACGTSLLKLDRVGGALKVKALRFDSFYPVVSYSGDITELFCFIKDFTKLADVGGKHETFENFYVVEHRYFGEYAEADGTVSRHKPLVKYEIRRSTGTITNGQDYATSGATVSIKQLPSSVRSEVAKTFDGVFFDKPIPLPFPDSLGAELVKWSDCVSALPELPFGDGLLTNIKPFLMSYDYYFSAFNTDMYLARGRVIVPGYMQSVTSMGATQNAGLDSMLFTRVPTMTAEETAPIQVQFDLRSSSWKEIRDMLLQNIAVNTGINLSTLAPFLQDSNGNRTAREISTEESETSVFVEDKREIIERPVNRLLKLVTMYYGYKDDVVIRWSESGLTNIYTRTDMLATAVQNGLISRQTASSLFRQDDDEYQQAEEWEKICADEERRTGALEGGADEEGFAEFLGKVGETVAEEAEDDDIRTD